MGRLGWLGGPLWLGALSLASAAQAVETASVAPGLVVEDWSSPPESAPPSALELRFTPRLRATSFVDATWDRTDLQVFELWLDGGFELDVRVSERLQAFVSPSFFLAYGLSERGASRSVGDVLVPEAHATWTEGPWRLRLGTQVFSWGSSDLIGPSDVLNPYDLRRGFVALPRELEVPQLAAELTWRHGALTLRGVVEPLFTGSRFFLSGWDTGLLRVLTAQGFVLPELELVYGPASLDRVGDQLLVWNPPDVRPDRWTYGFRASLDLEPWVLSMTAVYGYEALPAVDIDPALVRLASDVFEAVGRGTPLPFGDPAFAQAFADVDQAVRDGRSLFRGTYERRGLLGLDASVALDPFVLKADVALSLERTFYTQAFKPFRVPSVMGVLGFDFVHGARVQLTVEGFLVAALNLPADTRIALFEPRSSEPTAAGRTVLMPGAAMVLRVSILDELALEAAGIFTTSRQDYSLAPTLKWQLGDHHGLRLGAIILGGGRDGYGWTYAQDDRWLLSWTWAP